MLHSLLQASRARYRASANISAVNGSILATQHSRLARRVLEVWFRGLHGRGAFVSQSA